MGITVSWVFVHEDKTLHSRHLKTSQSTYLVLRHPLGVMFGDGNFRCPYINSPWNATALREKQVPHMQDPMAKKNTHTRIPTAERATTMYNF